jgi:methionyl-tRNA formyltransferase
VAVVTAPPRPAGRGRRLRSTPIAEVAGRLGLPILTPRRLRASEALAEVLAFGPELAVLADYGQLVPPPILDLPHGALNLHPSLLPRHRGAAPIAATILAGDRETGVTLFRMDAGLDTGPIVARRIVPVGDDETADHLEARLAIVAAELLAEALGPWLRGAITPEPQAAEGATLTRPLRRGDGRLDPSRPAVELERRVRALRPWPGTFLETPAGRLGVRAARVVPAGPGDEPGRLVAAGDGLALTTVDDRLELLLVQPAGGRVMTAAEYRRGRPWIVGRAVGGQPVSGASMGPDGPAAAGFGGRAEASADRRRHPGGRAGPLR